MPSEAPPLPSSKGAQEDQRPSNPMYYVYILQSLKDNSYYTGLTMDVKERLKSHNNGSVDYTSTKRPFKLVWYCCFNDKSKALKFEKYIKSGSGFALARKRLV